MYWDAPPADQTIHQALRSACARYGDREMMTFVDRRMSLVDVAADADRVARALLASGIGRGDKVAVMMAAYAPWMGLFFGSLQIGAIIVPVNTRSRPDEIEFALTHSGAKIVFFKRERKGRTDYGDLVLEVFPELAEGRAGPLNARRAPTVREVVDVAEPAMRGTVSYAEFLERGRGVTSDQVAAAASAVQPYGEACVLYTSGTTSVPKGARLYHTGMVRGGWQVARVLRMRDDDVYFSVQPVYHSGGAIGALLPPLISGARLVAPPYFDAGQALDTLERERVTVLVGHQPHFVEYLNHPTLPQRKLAVERVLPIAPPDLFWAIKEKLGIDGLVSGYGMTETHMLGTYSSLADDPIEVRFNTNGKPTFGVKVEIRDPDDGETVLGAADEGEIWMHVPHPMLGYLGEPGLTREVLGEDGWYRTGDRGVIRADGNLVLLGRVRDMIRVGGENLSGAEVEACLLQHPAVKQAAALPSPDPRLGEIVIAFVEVKPGARSDADELIAFCRTKLSHYKVPRAVHFVTEWPISGTGKLQKRLLLETVRA
jgi:acyl-CoA synthetase (AMP-forming)/AMP-acid ligase II